MEYFKGRQLFEGMLVRAYLNWNKGTSIFSIVDHKSGLVVAYSESITLKNVEFKVSQRGLQRVREEKCKNVHAWALGEFVAEQQRPCDLDCKLFYDPYKVEAFVLDGTNRPIQRADLVHLADRRVWIGRDAYEHHLDQFNDCDTCHDMGTVKLHSGAQDYHTMHEITCPDCYGARV